ncbi:MAG: site-specific integrase [Lachnospiraceae bacterium]|nr:site-specific integrase [Lachnospiraceae bacterium]
MGNNASLDHRITEIKELACLLDSSIIDAGSADTIKVTLRDKVERLHTEHYSITAPNPDKPKSRWQTSYKTEDGKRHNIKASTKEALLDQLIKLYSGQLNFDKLTFYSLYKEWLEYKTKITESRNTIKRHEQHYKKYFKTSKLHNMKLKDIDKLTLEVEFNRIVKDFNLTRKEWYNARSIVNGMFDYALDRKYINNNPLDRVKVTVRYRPVKKKKSSTQVYNSDEYSQITRYLDFMFATTGDPAFLACRFNFMVGLRVGELVALKWEDIEDSKLWVYREEIRDQYENKYYIVNHVKTADGRVISLIPQALEILKEVPRTSDFIFAREGTRITSRQIEYVLKKYAERNGLATKSTHKMRKTCASRMHNADVPIDTIRQQLGHSTTAMTWEYIYDPLAPEETYNRMSQAF